MKSTNTKRHRNTAYRKHPLSKFRLKQDVVKLVPHMSRKYKKTAIMPFVSSCSQPSFTFSEREGGGGGERRRKVKGKQHKI